MTDLNNIQYQAKGWRERNFPGYDAEDQLMGVMEELGEISHHYLKRKQGIRGDETKHTTAIMDGVGDLVIFLMGFCDKEGIYLADVVEDVWDTVKARDWLNDPAGGVA